MAVEMISVKCPECGASVELDQRKRSAVCSYCGTKIIMHDDNTISIRDEAEIIHAETEQAVKFKQMEMRENRQLKDLRLGKKSLKIAGLLAVIGIVFGIIIGPMLSFLPDVSGNGENFVEYIGGMCLLIAMLIGGLYFLQWFKTREEEKKDYEIQVEGKLALPKDYSDYCDGNYHVVEQMLREAGFTNIRTIPLRDVIKDSPLRKADFVKDITFDGEKVTNYNQTFRKNASIVIKYHSYK